MKDITLGSKDIAGNKKGKVPALMEFTFWLGKVGKQGRCCFSSM